MVDTNGRFLRCNERTVRIDFNGLGGAGRGSRGFRLTFADGEHRLHRSHPAFGMAELVQRCASLGLDRRRRALLATLLRMC